jgi:ubiquinone/menaquinone biosynthesis C-methylase UbiE
VAAVVGGVLWAQQAKEPEIIVPFVPTHPKVVEAMLKLAEVKPGDTVYDLGCGDGRIVISAVKDFKAKRGLGIDFNPERLKDCARNMDEAKLTPEQRQAITFKQGDVLKLTPEDFKDVDVVTLYLLPEVNLRLRPVLQKGLKPGARIVSHDFDMGDWKPDQTKEVVADRTHTIYLWVIKEKK